MSMNYGNVAALYQLMSRMVFGKALINTQVKALANLKQPCNLLIAGGGDGEVLKYLADFKGELDYVEVSSRMVKLAQSKTKLPVHWYVQDIFTFKTGKKYDTTFLPFLLDNFSPNQCYKLVSHLKQMLRPEGEIIVVDFTETPTFWQKGLLAGMYLFFRIFSKVKTNRLPEIEQTMLLNNLEKTLETKSFRGFIEIKNYKMIS